MSEFKQRVRDAQELHRAMRACPTRIGVMARVLQCRALETCLFESGTNLSDSLREALVNMAQVVPSAASRYASNPAIRALSVVVNPRDALVSSSRQVAGEWKAAIDAEFHALIDSGVLAICEPSDVRRGDDVLPSMAILTRKDNGRLKCRIVACGNYQSAHPGDVFASVAGHMSWVTHCIGFVRTTRCRCCLVRRYYSVSTN